MRIIGIDPGLQSLGWGVVRVKGSRLQHLGNGQCRTMSGQPLAARLCSLHEALSDVLARFAPEAAAIEQTFVNRDGAATLKLGQARGVALLALAQAGLAPGEYAPNAVKKAIVGVGHADKRQVAHMVAVLLPGVAPASRDAADALAVAICHAHHAGPGARLSAAIAAAGG